MRVRVSIITLALAILVGCGKPDLSPIRDGLVKNAAVVCAPPPVRPAHAPKKRDVPTADLIAALVALCDSSVAHAAPPAGAVDVLHDALLADRANVGEVRRNHLKTEPAGPITCDATFGNVDRVLLRSASAAKSVDESLDRCADVVAVARDQDLAGAATDVLFANGLVQSAVEACLPIVEHAPADAAARFHKSLVVLRSTFPATLDDAVARDSAEDVLVAFGRVRAQDAPLACPRATLLANLVGGPGDDAQLLARWREPRTPLAHEEYREAYALTLGALDRLVSLAELVSQPSSRPATAKPRDAQAP